MGDLFSPPEKQITERIEKIHDKFVRKTRTEVPVRREQGRK